MKINRTQMRNLLILSLFILIGSAFLERGIRVSADPAPELHYVELRANVEQATPALTVAGTYLGSVRIEEPAPLGALELVFEVIDDGGALSGQVNNVRTQVFLGGPSFTGDVNASTGMTPTFQLVSGEFESVISGRTVQRQFMLTGEILDEGDVLRGDYVETIVGFKPNVVLVTGTFLVSRPGGSTDVINIPAPDDPPTPTPTATLTRPGQNNPSTPTPTVPVPGNGNPGGASNIFLPLVSNRAGAIRAGVAQSADVVAAPPSPTATPTPTSDGGTVKLPPTPAPTETEGTTTLPPHSAYLPIVGKE